MAKLRSFSPRFEALEVRDVPAALFVSTTGSDANPGTSAAPWRTLQHAAGRVAAGDVVTVRPGDYAGFHLTRDGTAAAPITFRGDPGARVTARNPVTPDGINLEGADHVVIEGFAVVNQPRAGIRSALNHHVTVRGNTCDSNGRWGVFTGFTDDVLIENNVTSRSRTEHGIYVSNSGDRPVIRGNTSWGNYACGVHMNGDLSMGGDGIISAAVVEGNVIYDVGRGGGSGINADGVQDSVFRNNLVYNVLAGGITLFRTDGAAGSRNNLVANNTVLVAAGGRWAVNIMSGSTHNTVRNNVLFSGHSFRGAVSATADSLAGLVSDYNAVEDRFSRDGGSSALTLAQWRAATGQDANSLVVADPALLFVNPAAGDYRLRAGAAVVDRGTATSAPPADLYGTPRPSGAGVDIGHAELPADTAPTLSAIADQTVPANGTTGAVAFAVADAETPAGSLVVTAASSDLTLLPPAGVALGGSGGSRTVTLTPALGRSGTATVTLTVTDGGGRTATRAFTLTVTPTPLNPSATFVGTDAATKGSWVGKYGAAGYTLAGGPASLPAGTAVTLTGKADHVWASSTADVRAVQLPAGGRRAAAWVAATTFTAAVDLPAGTTRRVSVYLLDWSRMGRGAKVEVLDPATGAVLDTRTASNSVDGLYLTWEVTGSVLLRLTRTAGANLTASGIFLD